MLVGVVAMAASFVAGLLSPRLVNLFVVWIIVLGSIAVAFVVIGASSADVPPILFAIILSLIYGTLAYVVYGVGVGGACVFGGYGGVGGRGFVTRRLTLEDQSGGGADLRVRQWLLRAL